MTFNLPLNNPAPRDWRGLILLLMALLIYLVGPLGDRLARIARPPEEINLDTLAAGLGNDSDPGIANRRAIFLMRPIDLNQADAVILASLPGIGPGLAARIIAHRDQRGCFKRVADITEVAGIGPRKLAGFVNDVTVKGCI